MLEIFLLVLSLGAVSFGGGQMLLAGLERELVQSGRLDPQSFAVAVALGLSTPGPLAAFTTAIGMSLHGFGGGVAATGALIVVSLSAVALITRIPMGWFRLPPVKAGLMAVAPLAAALVSYLGLKTVIGAAPGVVGTIVIAGVIAGRLAKLPTYALVLVAIGVGAILA